ncbi:MAG: putative glycosyl transferase [Methanosaeta sp. PtaU1.Bin060]|nr:MAG: putative glycosyl transferase [Methanosaeta sp. PtaU1.Bin060]
MAKILMVGPTPSQNGGVSNFIKNFIKSDNFETKCNVLLYKNGKIEQNESIFKTLIRDTIRIIQYPFSKDFWSSGLVHIHTASYLSFYKNSMYVIISKMFNKKVILHIHGAEFHLFYKKSKFLERYIIRNTLLLPDMIIVTSYIWVSRIKDIVNSDKKILSVPNGFDPTIFRPFPRDKARDRVGILKNKKALITIGHLENYKGHKYLIDAVNILSKKRNDILVYIIGEGSLRYELQNQIDSYDVEVVLAGGNKPDFEIPLWINASDIFILPSLAEGNPTVMFEALGCGKPFLGTRVGGVPDVIIDNRLGILVEPGDPEALAQAILQALECEWDHEYIWEYAQQFTWENIAKEIVKIYQSLL